MLEYALGAATVAVGWSGYIVSLCANAGSPIPLSLTGAPLARNVEPDDNEKWVRTGSVLNLPAILVVIFVTAIQVRGMKESARLNNVLVALKIVILLLFLFATCGSVDTANWQPFVPPAQGRGTFGVAGIFRGASVVFFSYIGEKELAWCRFCPLRETSWFQQHPSFGWLVALG